MQAVQYETRLEHGYCALGVAGGIEAVVPEWSLLRQRPSGETQDAYTRSKVMTSAWCLRLAAVSGFFVVALGAFGAHGLKPTLEMHQTLAIWEKAVLYHAIHTLAL